MLPLLCLLKTVDWPQNLPFQDRTLALGRCIAVEICFSRIIPRFFGRITSLRAMVRGHRIEIHCKGRLLQALSDMPNAAGDKLWLPNARGLMQEGSALVFNDAPWLEAQGMNFIHPKLSYEVSPLEELP